MKVRCKNFEGNLISINPTTTFASTANEYKIYLYTIEIELNPYQTITISNVEDKDIEFVNEEIEKYKKVMPY